MNIINKKINILSKKYKKFLIAYSGGIDSTTLLYSLKQNNNIKNKNIRAIHINHNLSKLSKNIEKNCINICKKWKINLIIKNIYIKKKNNIQNKFRKKRYKICIKNLINKEILLTAHHKNDQCETILLSIKRGSGLDGLSGIKKKLKIKKKIIIRPFLNIKKKIIIKYAKKNNLNWINDKSNKNIKFDRNFIRIKILPLIYKKWPFFLNCITRTSLICLKQKKLLEYFIKKKFKKILLYNNSLNIKKISKKKKQQWILILRKWIKINKKKMLSFKNINLLFNNLITKIKKIYFQLIFKEFIIYKYKNLIFLKNKNKYKNKTIIWKNINKKIKLPNNIGYLSINGNNKKNKIRKPYKNEIIYIKFNYKGTIYLNKKIKIKKIWQKYKIYPWERKNKPIIFYNKKPIICPNFFITKYGKIKNNNFIIIKLTK